MEMSAGDSVSLDNCVVSGGGPLLTTDSVVLLSGGLLMTGPDSSDGDLCH